MKQVECNKCGKVFEVEGEWGYCPFCENDQVEVKLPNDLIKATDYDKAKDRIIHEFEYVNGKFIQHYALGGEHELTTQEIVDCLNALLTIDCDLRTAYAYIKGQNDEIKVLEKALELACDYLTTNQDEYDELTRLVKNIYNDEEYLKTKINYFKDKAKEMINNG